MIGERKKLTLAWGRLNSDGNDLAVLDDNGTALQTGSTEDGSGVENEAELGGEGGVVVGDCGQ